MVDIGSVAVCTADICVLGGPDLMLEGAAVALSALDGWLEQSKSIFAGGEASLESSDVFSSQPVAQFRADQHSPPTDYRRYRKSHRLQSLLLLPGGVPRAPYAPQRGYLGLDSREYNHKSNGQSHANAWV